MLHQLLSKDYELPKQIKELKIHDGVSMDEAYLYKFTCLDTGKKYLGSHLDDDGIYWQSSESEEFRNVFSDSNSNLKLEILETGKHDWITFREYTILKDNDVVKSDEWWNKSYGSPKTKTDNLDFIKKLGDRVESGEFEQTDKLSKEFVHDLEIFQSRHTLYHQSHKTRLQNLMDEKAGSTEDFGRIVLLEDYDGKGKHRVIGGIHRRKAFLDAKHTVEIGYDLIPKSQWLQISNTSSLVALGNILNRREREQRIEMDVDDGARYCELLYIDGKSWWNDSVIRYLTDCGFTDGERTKIKQKAQSLIDDHDKKRKPGMVWNQWAKEDVENEVKQIEKNFPQYIVLSAASGAFNSLFTKIVKTAMENNNRYIYLVLHHTAPRHEEAWENKGRQFFKEGSKFCDINIEIRTLQCWATESGVLL